MSVESNARVFQCNLNPSLIQTLLLSRDCNLFERGRWSVRSTRYRRAESEGKLETTLTTVRAALSVKRKRGCGRLIAIKIYYDSVEVEINSRAPVLLRNRGKRGESI